MKRYYENNSVIYTDKTGRKFDTFVINDTDEVTGLTHINHENLRVPSNMLTLHAATISGSHLPMRDAFSFEIFRKLKEKYERVEQAKGKQLDLSFLSQAS